MKTRSSEPQHPHQPRHPRAPGWPPEPGSPRPGPAVRRRRKPWIRLVFLFVIACVALALLGVSLAQASTLDDFVRLQVGSFTSEAQAKQDARYDAITWHIAEIWPDDDPDERWLYTESWMPDAPAPCMQRVSRLRQEADGTISARRYTLPEAPRFVGAWQEPAKFASLKPADLADLDGCDAVITRFPCLEAARQFWHSPEYAEIRKLREGIAEFEVLVLPVPPLPK